MSINSIENLSNEIFYEIFDYLDCCEIYKSFLNLNHRFQQLLTSSTLLLKVKLCFTQSIETFMNNYHEIFLNKNEILSIHLWISDDTNQFILPMIFESPFNYLESLIFNSIELDVLTLLLPKLTCLPRLFSLTIDTESYQNDHADIYRLIFNLPKLKFMKYRAMECDEFDTTISLPIVTKEQITSIEHLIINHPCAFDDLFTIISYTPYLRRLKFFNLTDRNVDIRDVKPIILSNLTHLSIKIYEMSFDELEIFINKLNSNLKILSLNIIPEDIDYLDANRWERFILNNLPQLEKFYFTYAAHFEENSQPLTYLEKRDQFSSSFWLERQWILETEIKFDKIIYSILPYKKRWYEYDTERKTINQYSKSTRLIISDVSPEKWFKTLSIDQYINHILTVTKIYHLEIQDEISFNKLSQILCLLPELDSLHIGSVSFSKPKSLSKATQNQITKVCLDDLNLIEEIDIFMDLFGRMNHLQINSMDYTSIELILRFISLKMMNKSDHSLRLLCFCVAIADDQMVKNIEKIISFEKLILDFKVKRVMDKIYVQWK